MIMRRLSSNVLRTANFKTQIALHSLSISLSHTHTLMHALCLSHAVWPDDQIVFSFLSKSIQIVRKWVENFVQNQINP